MLFRFALLAALLPAGALAATGPFCSGFNVQTASVANLAPTSAWHQVLVRQPDRSYTAFELTSAAPTFLLGQTPHFERLVMGCLPNITSYPAIAPNETFFRLATANILHLGFTSPACDTVNCSSAVEVSEVDASLRGVSQSSYPIKYRRGYLPSYPLSNAVDWNGDGVADSLVAICQTRLDAPCSLIVMLGSGGSSFRLLSELSLPGSATIYDAVAADVNRDGRMDLLLVTNSSPFDNLGHALVLLGNGDGTFQPVRTIASGGIRSGPRSVAVGDLNGDGKLDAVVGFQKETHILFGNGDGAFTDASVLDVPAYTGMSVADVDQDGKLDILAASDSQLSILFGDGKGGITRRTGYLLPGNGKPLLTDFDADGRPDIVLGTGNAEILGGNTISVLFGLGGGRFYGAQVSYVPHYNDTNNSAGREAAGDFNGDGKPDVVLAKGPWISVLKSLGTGEFSTMFQSDFSTIGQPIDLVVADLNGDSKPDFAVLVNKLDSTCALFVFLGKGDGTFLSATSVPVAQSPQYKSMHVADFNGDTRPDLALIVSGRPRILLGDGNGGFHESLPPPIGASSIAVGDFDRDGRDDLAVMSDFGRVLVWASKADGTYTSTISPVGSGSLYSGDWNRDGITDLAITSGTGVQIAMGVGDGTLRLGSSYSLSSSPAEIVAADLNGDGKVDLLTGGTAVLFGNGDGTFQSESIVPGLGGIPADLNADGRIDAIAGQSVNGVASTMRDPGPNTTLSVVSSASPLSTAIAPESLASAFGSGFSQSSQVAVQDGAGTIRVAALLFVSPTQINFQVPAGTVAGEAIIRVWNGSSISNALRQTIATVAPGLFTFNASGLAAAYITRFSADGRQTTESVDHPLNIGVPGEQVYLSLFGTGIRGATTPVTATTNGRTAEVTYAGPQGTIGGLDQVNVLIPPELAGAGDVTILISAGGVAANPVHITIAK